MRNRKKAQAIKDLGYSWYLRILSNYTRLKARAILREFSNITILQPFTYSHAVSLNDNIYHPVTQGLSWEIKNHLPKKHVF